MKKLWNILNQFMRRIQIIKKIHEYLFSIYKNKKYYGKMVETGKKILESDPVIIKFFLI